MRKWGTVFFLIVFTAMHSIVGIVDDSRAFSNRTTTVANVQTASFVMDQQSDELAVECCSRQMFDLAGLSTHSPLECKLLISIETTYAIKSFQEHVPSNPKALEKRENHILFRPPIV